MTVWLSGSVGAPNAPCRIRQNISSSSDCDNPHISVEAPKPAMQAHIDRLRPNRLTSHPVIGVAIAVARRLNVTIHDTSSAVADMAPWICGMIEVTTMMVVKYSITVSMPLTSRSRRRLSDIGGGDVSGSSVAVPIIRVAGRSWKVNSGVGALEP